MKILSKELEKAIYWKAKDNWNNHEERTGKRPAPFNEYMKNAVESLRSSGNHENILAAYKRFKNEKA